VKTALRMTRYAAIAFTVALASTVAILVHGVPLAHASSCTSDMYYTGYLNLGLPNVGTTQGLYINFLSSNRSSGSIRGHIQYVDNQGNKLTTGILNTGDGPEAYIEYNGSFKVKTPVSYDHAYHFWITHDSTSEFTAHADAFGSYQGFVRSGSSYQPAMYIESTSTSTSGTCNLYTYDFSGLEPLTISDFSEPLYASPYSLQEISDKQFKTYLTS
jgi:hypothetical protein